MPANRRYGGLTLEEIEREAELTNKYSMLDLAARIRELEKVLGATRGYMLNAKIDLETGTKKATTIATLAGGLRMVDEALGRDA